MFPPLKRSHRLVSSIAINCYAEKQTDTQDIFTKATKRIPKIRLSTRAISFISLAFLYQISKGSNANKTSIITIIKIRRVIISRQR
jgi:hypothetical protein